MRIDHIGYAVKNIDKVRGRFESLGYIFDEKLEDLSREFYIQFGMRDGYRIGLVSPIESSSPVDRILSAIGATPYHICYKRKFPLNR